MAVAFQCVYSQTAVVRSLTNIDDVACRSPQHKEQMHMGTCHWCRLETYQGTLTLQIPPLSSAICQVCYTSSAAVTLWNTWSTTRSWHRKPNSFSNFSKKLSWISKLYTETGEINWCPFENDLLNKIDCKNCAMLQYNHTIYHSVCKTLPKMLIKVKSVKQVVFWQKFVLGLNHLLMMLATSGKVILCLDWKDHAFYALLDDGLWDLMICIWFWCFPPKKKKMMHGIIIIIITIIRIIIIIIIIIITTLLKVIIISPLLGW